MKNKILAISVIVPLLFFVISVSASVSSVTTSASATTATTGTNVIITASITATGTESQSVSIITSPSGITVSDPSGGQYQSVSLSSTPTSKTFTISAAATNTYTYYATSGGTPSTEETIVFVNPSTLTVSGSPSSTSGASGGTFTESITISNPSSSAVTTSYALSCPSGFTCSGNPTSSSGITISAGSSTQLSWTVTIGGTSSSATVSLQLGDTSGAFTTSVSCTNCATTTTTTTAETAAAGGAATTPGVKVTTQKGKATITIPSIAAGKSATVNINKTEDVAVTQVIINVKNSVNNIQVVVTKLAEKPATVTQEVSGKVYHYIEVNKTNITDTSVNNATLRFKVEKSWLTSNNVNESTVALYRYDNNAWNKLETTKIGDLDTDNILYEAVSPGLSVFAISGDLNAGAPTVPSPEEQPEVTPEEFVEGVKKDSWKIVLIVIGFVAAVGAIVILAKKKMIKLNAILPKKSSWDDLRKKYSKK